MRHLLQYVLALAPIVSFACADDARLEVVSAPLSVAQCDFFLVDQVVPVCHRAPNGKRPYQLVRASYRECVREHSTHAGDYIGFNDPNCTGVGCFPLGAPRDPTHAVPCCEGLDYDATGHCAPVAASIEVWSDTPSQRIEGRVSAGVAGQVVELYGHSWSWDVSGLRAVTTDDGRFTFDMSGYGWGGWWDFDPKWYTVTLADGEPPAELTCDPASRSEEDPHGKYPGRPGCASWKLIVPCDSLFDDYWGSYLPGTMALEFSPSLDFEGEEGVCVASWCPERATLEEATGSCRCESGYHADGSECVETVYDVWPVTECAELMPALAGANARFGLVDLRTDIDLATCGAPPGGARRSGFLVPQFFGSIHGNGHALSGYRSDSPMLGQLSSEGEITDLFVLGADVLGSYLDASVVTRDMSSRSALRDVHVTGTVRTGGNAGGLVVSAWAADLEGCSFVGDVTSFGAEAGGLAALYHGGLGGALSDSFASGTVTGYTAAGGLAAEAIYDARIASSYFRGDVSATLSVVGGLVGYLEGGIDDSYAAGTVSGGDFRGRLAGAGAPGAFVHDSYAEGTDGELFGLADGMDLTGDGFGTLADIYANVIASWSLDRWVPDPAHERDPRQLCGGVPCPVYCPSGDVVCDGACVDPASDGEHCGASGDCTGEGAGVACAPGDTCSLGVCATPPDNAVCPSGAIDVSGFGSFSGTILAGDSAAAPDCGAWGSPGVHYVAGPGLYHFELTPGFALRFDAHECGSGAGFCETSSAFDIELGVTNYLVVKSLDPASSQSFVLSVQSACYAPNVLCGNACLDPRFDGQHCGATAGCGDTGGDAGQVCGHGEYCSDGICQSVCPAGEVLCPEGCVDPATSLTRCGASGECSGENAGSVCDADHVCQGGQCVVPPPPTNVTCPADAIDVTGLGTFGGTTCGGDPQAATSCGGAGAPGVYYVAQAGLYDFSLTPGFALQLDAYGCGSEIGFCNDSGFVDAGLGVVHYLTVQSLAPEGCGPYSLTVTCATGVMCDGECVFPWGDRAHCGATPGCGEGAGDPGVVCQDGEACQGGVCVGISCGAPNVICGSDCIDPRYDNNHCGATEGCGESGGSAGVTCDLGESCDNGSCRSYCPPGWIYCLEGCIDPASSTHCGASDHCFGANTGTVCDAGAICDDGACVVPPPPTNVTCPAEAIDVTGLGTFSGTTCGGDAAATTSCGGAGTPGVYYVADPGIYSFAVTPGFALQLDADSCGSAESSCSDYGYAYSDSSSTQYLTVQSLDDCGPFSLTVSCGTGVVCDGTCVQPWSDTAHCGATQGCGEGEGHPGVACGPDETCEDGICMPPPGVYSCPENAIDISAGIDFQGTTCNGSSAPWNWCGGSGAASTYFVAGPGSYLGWLSPGFSIQFDDLDKGSGFCQASGGSFGATLDRTYCVTVQANEPSECGDFTLTVERQCPDGELLCDGDCVDPSTDPRYCGATEGCGADAGSAGEACPLDETCIDGTCGQCPPGHLPCGDDCVDPMTDGLHCGATGCSAPDAGVVCDEGETCQAGVCAMAAAPNAVCPEGAIDVSERGTFTGSTCGGDGEADSCGGSGSPGVYFVIGPGTYTWTLTPDFSIQYDAYSCGSGIGGCESPDHSYVYFGVTHYLVVASTSPYSCGHFTLTIE